MTQKSAVCSINLLIVVFLLAPTALLGQGTTLGTIRGTVVDASKGGGAGAAFFIFRTADSGATWQSAVIQGGQDAEDVYFLDPNIGYVRTRYPDTGRLFRTADGARTFTGVGGSPGDRMKFAEPGVGWSFHYGTLSYTTTGGERWTSRTINFPATVYAFALPSRRRAYVVGNHGMVYRYSIVPVEYSVPNMIDAPMMPAEVPKAAAAPGRAAR